MIDVSDKKVLVVDDGMFIEFAIRLARDFKKVLYWTNWKSEYPLSKDDMIGVGVPGIERVSELFDYIDKVDLIVFTSIYYGDLQEFLVKKGYRVFGSRKGDELERKRVEAIEHFKDLGLPQPKYKQIIGIDNLIKYLSDKEDKWIKVSEYRGKNETWHYIDKELSSRKLAEKKHELGDEGKVFEFLVFDPINGDDIVECGFDTPITVDGKYPKSVINGYEKKDCFDKYTEVLTDDGWKLFKDLNKNEKIFTLNISDKRHVKFEYQAPTDYIEKDYKGKLVYIEKDTVSLCCTPTHNVLVRDTYQLENGEDLKWTSCLDGSISTFKRGGKTMRLRQIKDLIDKNKSFQLFQPTGIYVPPNPNKNKIEIGDKAIHKGHLAEFMGWYLSEGCSRVKGKSGMVNIAQFKYVDQLESCLKKMPWKYHRVKSGFNIYNYDLAVYLKQFGLSKDKYIPQWVKESGKAVINRFLDAYCYGDGGFTKNYKRVRKDSSMAKLCPDLVKEKRSRNFHTISPRMRDDLQELIIKVGNVSASYVQHTYLNNTTKQYTDLYFIQEKVINRKNHIFPKDINYIDYDDKVYCVTVPNGIIMTRRNGKAMWCGNCAYLCRVRKYSDLSPVITDFNEKIAPTLEEYQYRNAMSTEIRVGKNKVPYMIDMTCFSDDTEVLTNDGWKLFKDCTVENTFATLNIENNHIEYQHALNYIEKDFVGNMTLLTNNKKTIECLITPDHDVLRYDRHKEKLFKEKANDLTDKGYIPRTGIYTNNEDGFFELPEYHNEWDFIGQYGHTICTKTKHEPLLKIPMKKWAAFLAWYLAEGSTSRGYIVSLSQFTRCDELEHVLKDLGIKYSKLKKGFQISSVQLATYLQQFGICNEKYIPRYILDSSYDVIRTFLDNYILADGSTSDNKKIYRTTSKAIIDGLQECIFKTGSVGNIYSDRRKGTEVIGFKDNNKVYIRNHDCLSIIERQNFTDYWFETGCRKDRYIKDIYYDGKVYCLTVPNGTLYVRRNGKPFWSGNCRQPSPPGEIYLELIGNFSEMVWGASEGILVEPIYLAKYAIEVMVNSCAAENGWLDIRFPKSIRKWVKLRNLAVIDDVYTIIPRHNDFNNIGAVIAIGDSIEEVVELAKQRCKMIKGEDIECKLDDIKPLMEIIKKGEGIGLKF